MNLTEEDIERFWSKVDKGSSDECWEWTGRRSAYEYGVLRCGGSDKYSHRISAYIEYGDIENKIICHHCDNPPCVNPDHLYVGTQADNVRDAIVRGNMDGLGPKAVKEIRIAYDEDKTLTTGDLAKKYGFHPTSVQYAITGKTYKYVGGPVVTSTTRRGSRNCNAELTDSDVVEMRKRAEDGESTKKLSEDFNITRTNVSYILTGETWTHVEGPIQDKKFNRSDPLNPQQALEIRFRWKYGDYTQKEIGEMYNTSNHVVHKIVNRKNFSDLDIR